MADEPLTPEQKARLRSGTSLAVPRSYAVALLDEIEALTAAHERWAVAADDLAKRARSAELDAMNAHGSQNYFDGTAAAYWDAVDLVLGLAPPKG